MTLTAWRALFVVTGVAILGAVTYAHDIIPGWELILGIVVGALLVVAGLRGRVL